MLYTTNYDLVKIELKDSPADITVINQNWDKIDQALKTVDGKTGGTIAGNTTIEGYFTVDSGTIVTQNITNPLQLRVDATRGTAPSENKILINSITDKNGQKGLASSQYVLETDNTASLGFYLSNPVKADEDEYAGLWIRWNAGKAQFGLTSHPENNSNDYSIPTTYWVTEKIQSSPKTQLIRYD